MLVSTSELKIAKKRHCFLKLDKFKGGLISESFLLTQISKQRCQITLLRTFPLLQIAQESGLAT